MHIMNVEISEILGAFTGDGWITSSLKSLYITGNSSEEREYYDYFLGPLFSKHFSKVTPKEFIDWKVYGIGCHKSKIISKCLSLGFQSGPKALVAKTPHSIYNSQNKEIKIAFIRGFFDTDGSIWFDKSRAKTTISHWKKKYHYSPRITLGSCSKILLEQIQIMLTQLNINSKLRQSAKKGRKCNRNINNFYVLIIQKKEDILTWIETIGTNNPRHQTRIDVWKIHGFLPPRTRFLQRKLILSEKLDPYSIYV